MQTFLPHPNFALSAHCLDRLRLGKQRVECMQLLRALTDEAGGWKNHPATKMWRGYEGALALYMSCCIREWVRRGYKNNMETPYDEDCVPLSLVTWSPSLVLPRSEDIIFPKWLGDEDFHDSHKSNLLSKDYDWYSQFEWKVDAGREYIWPEENAA